MNIFLTVFPPGIACLSEPSPEIIQFLKELADLRIFEDLLGDPDLIASLKPDLLTSASKVKFTMAGIYLVMPFADIQFNSVITRADIKSCIR